MNILPAIEIDISVGRRQLMMDVVTLDMVQLFHGRGERKSFEDYLNKGNLIQMVNDVRIIEYENYLQWLRTAHGQDDDIMNEVNAATV